MTNLALVNGLTGIGILTFCFGMYKLTNGRLTSKVNRDECKNIHAVTDRRFNDFKTFVSEKIEDTKEHFDIKIENLKEFIKKENGNGKIKES